MLTRAPLDIRKLLATRRPGYTLEAAFYTAPEILDLDLDIIFGRHWIFVASEAEVPAPGDYVSVDIGRNGIILVRGGDGTVRAFHNVCRHRGARLVDAGGGSASRLVCPYHRWTYQLSGELFYAPHLDRGLDKACLGLKPVHLHSIGGLLFVCLAKEPPADIAGMDAVLSPRLAHFDIRNAKVAKQVDLIEHGNWKLVMENNRECYHCSGSHPELMVSLPEEALDYSGGAGSADVCQPVEQAAQEAAWEAAGFPSRTVEHLADRATGFRTQRLVLAGAGESMTLDTKIACRKLMGSIGRKQLGDLHLWTQPNSWHHFMSDHAITFCVLPVGVDNTLLRTTWLVHKDAAEGVDYDLGNLTQVWLATNAQDADLVARAHRGIRGAGYEPGPYLPGTEGLVEKFARWYVSRLSAHMASVP
jgi:Rieske 2Fe-2S family protein